ncbi:MAG: hypothetical protein KF784_08905 [Fimbriimonadaceae bacterium]|nr:hypothetical protein [Fimbriimonadaceae bacterium]
MAPENSEKCQKKSSALPITAILLAAGLGMTALYLAKKSRAAQPEARAVDLLERCDRAATMLDRRLSDDFYIHTA